MYENGRGFTKKPIGTLDTWADKTTKLGKPWGLAGKSKEAVKPALSKEQVTAELRRKAMTPGSAAPSAANKAEYDGIVKSLSLSQKQPDKKFELVPYDGSQKNSDMMDSDNYNGGGMSMPTSSTSGVNPSSSTGQGQGMNFANDYMEQAYGLMTQLEKMMQTPYNFDYKTDPSYIAAVQQAQEGAKVASRNTMETMNDRGITNSSITSGQLGQIEQAAQNEPLKLIPQLEANAFNRQQQGISNQFNLLGSLMNAGQFQMGYDQTQSFHEDDNAFRTADMTGYYMPPEAQGLIQTIMDSKQAYAGATTAQDRLKAATDANNARSALKNLGIQNVDQMFGGATSLDQLGKNLSGFKGIETVQHQQIGKEDKRWEDQFGLEKERFGLDKEKFKWDKSQPRGGSGGGVTPTQMRSQNAQNMIYEMRSKLGENASYSDVMKWIGDNSGDIMALGVMGDMLGEADAIKKGGSKADGPGDYEIYQDAVNLVKDLPEYVSGTEDERKALVEKAKAELRAQAYPPQTPEWTGWSDAETQHKVKWKQRLY